MNYNLRESINANSILDKVKAIVSKTKIKHPKAEIIELDGTKYIYYSYFDKGFDDDGLDMVWDKCSDLKGVVDVGFGYGYGLENTKYEDSLLIELDDDVIVESKTSSRKSIKESKSDLLVDIQNLISSSGLLDSIADVEDTLEIAYMIAERLDPSDYGFKDEDALANKINFELKYDREYAKLFESKKFVRKSINESKDSYKVKVLNEMLDAMAKDEYNIPKVGIYGVTKNINLDEGAILTLIDYYN